MRLATIPYYLLFISYKLLFLNLFLQKSLIVLWVSNLDAVEGVVFYVLSLCRSLHNLHSSRFITTSLKLFLSKGCATKCCNGALYQVWSVNSYVAICC